MNPELMAPKRQEAELEALTELMYGVMEYLSDIVSERAALMNAMKHNVHLPDQRDRDWEDFGGAAL